LLLFLEYSNQHPVQIDHQAIEESVYQEFTLVQAQIAALN
jgi:hypothetical protein